MEQKEKLEIIEQIKLLSALESWLFSTGSKLPPDYLLENISSVIENLTKKLIGENDA